MAKKLLIKLTCAESAPEKASTAFAVAAAALASDIPVSFWLSGDAVSFALQEGATEISLEHAPPTKEVLSDLLARAEVFVCSPCLLRRSIDSSELKAGVKVAGATAFVSQTQEESSVLIY